LENNRLHVLVRQPPPGPPRQGLCERSVWRYQDRLDGRAPQPLFPTRLERLDRLVCVETAVEVDLRAAVDEDPVLGPEPPGAIPSPVVVVVEPAAARVGEQVVTCS